MDVNLKLFFMKAKCAIITENGEFNFKSFTFSDEFVNKYKDKYLFGNNNSLPVASKNMAKRYSDDIEKDIVNELKMKNNTFRS